MKLPYSAIPAKPDAAFPHRTEVSRPILALHLSKAQMQMVVFAIVDSGADQCLFPASIAETLGISIPNQHSSVFSGSNKDPQTAYFEELQATILPMEGANISPDQEPITFSLYAGFCDTLEHVGLGLLGQEGFFSKFTINFHASEQYFEISKLQPALYPIPG